MTDTTADPVDARRPLRGWQPALAATGLLMLAAMIPTGFLALTDPRTLNGAGVWDKPLKFEISTAIFLLMASWVFTRLPAGWSRTLAGRYVIWTAIVSALFEVIYIAFRASRGEASHYNFTSATTMALYTLMGVGALALTSTALVQGVAVLRAPPIGDPPAFRQALGWGLILTFVLGATAGGYMSAQTGHWVGGPASDAGGLPLFGWSTTGGDLRPPHFLGIHAAQILPVVALVFVGLAPKQAGWLTTLTILAYVALTVAVFVQAVSGQPLLAP